MSILCKVKATSFISKSGKLINRKAFGRIIKKKITLTQAKNRVRALHKGLDKLKELTRLDPENLEYGVNINKRFPAKGQVQITKGYINNGVKVVDLPTPKNYKDTWMLHSHPTPTPLSVIDITSVNGKGGSVFAISTDGSKYRATRLIGKESKNNKLITDTYETAKNKIIKSPVIKDYFDITKMMNRNLSDKAVKEELRAVIQHKLLKHLEEKGLIKYRSKLTEIAKKRINRYKDIMDIELKRHINLINFGHIPDSKWYKLSKVVRNKIRRIESKYNFDYELAARKSATLRKLYKQVNES